MQRAEQYPMSEAQRSDMYHTVLVQELQRYEAEIAAKNPYSTALPESWAADLAEYNREFSNATALFRGSKLG